MAYSILIALEFDYNGKKYDHQFWSIESLENYFRWEPGRGEMVGYKKDEGRKDQEPIRGRALLRLVALREGVEVKDVKFNQYSELILYLVEKKIVLGNREPKRR
jgi:hypothetical protein